MKQFRNIVPVLFIIMSLTVSAQVAKDDELYGVLKKKDSILFNAAFNTCDIDILNTIFTTDFEFYHDKGGITEGKEAFVGQIVEGCAQRNPSLPQPNKRILKPESLKVYPLYKNGELYGAIQHGIHSFEFLNKDNSYQKGDIAKFTHVWILENAQWKLRRELSYDHHLQQ